jgi:hypothetical protein
MPKTPAGSAGRSSRGSSRRMAVWTSAGVSPPNGLRRALVGADVVDSKEVRGVDGSGRPRLLLEAAQAIGVGHRRPRQHLDRHLAPQPGVPRPVHLAHAPGPEQAADLVRPEARPRGLGHEREPSVIRTSQGRTAPLLGSGDDRSLGPQVVPGGAMAVGRCHDAAGGALIAQATIRARRAEVPWPARPFSSRGWNFLFGAPATRPAVTCGAAELSSSSAGFRWPDHQLAHGPKRGWPEAVAGAEVGEAGERSCRALRR